MVYRNHAGSLFALDAYEKALEQSDRAIKVDLVLRWPPWPRHGTTALYAQGSNDCFEDARACTTCARAQTAMRSGEGDFREARTLVEL